MARYADALLAVHDGSPGTADIIRRMHAAGKPVHEVAITPKVGPPADPASDHVEKPHAPGGIIR